MNPPTGTLFAGPNLPLPFPKNIETSWVPILAAAISKSPSSLKSPTATADVKVPVPVDKVVAVSNVPLPLPKSIET